jgi:hypothetical protein
VKKPSNKKKSEKNLDSDDNFRGAIDIPSFIESSIDVDKAASLNNSIINKMFENTAVVDLSTAKANWYFGEWQALVDLDIQSLSNHPDVDKLTALKASAYQQLNDMEQSKAYFKLAKELGCDNSLISQLLIAGIHNSLGKVAALKKDDSKMLLHFDKAVNIGNNTQENKLARQARTVKEISQLGLLPQVGALFEIEDEKLSLPPSSSFNDMTSTKALINELQDHNYRLSVERDQMNALLKDEQKKNTDCSENLEKHIFALNERTCERDEQLLLAKSHEINIETLTNKLKVIMNDKESITSAFKLMERDLKNIREKYSKLYKKSNSHNNEGIDQ